MTASTRNAGWTRLLAGAVAHDINNFVQGVSSARALAAAPVATLTDAAETAAIIEDDLDQLRKLGGRLRALASAGGSEASTHLAGVCADALAEVDRPPEQMRAESIRADLCVVGTAAALTTAIASLLEHAVAASPASAPVRLAVHEPQVGAAVSVEPVSVEPVIVEILAPEAGELGAIGKTRLDVVLAGALREQRGDARLILAGAIADALGGAVYVASDARAGLVLALHLVAAPRNEAGRRLRLTPPSGGRDADGAERLHVGAGQGGIAGPGGDRPRAAARLSRRAAGGAHRRERRHRRPRRRTPSNSCRLRLRSSAVPRRRRRRTTTPRRRCRSRRCLPSDRSWSPRSRPSRPLHSSRRGWDRRPADSCSRGQSYRRCWRSRPGRCRRTKRSACRRRRPDRRVPCRRWWSRHNRPGRRPRTARRSCRRRRRRPGRRGRCRRR